MPNYSSLSEYPHQVPNLDQAASLAQSDPARIHDPVPSADIKPTDPYQDQYQAQMSGMHQ